MVKKSKSARRRKNVTEEDCNLDDEEMARILFLSFMISEFTIR